MDEVVAVADADESQEEVADATATPATPDPDLTTLTKRLRGKDQALTATQRERDELRKQFDELSRWKAEKEQADLTEMEKLQQERDRLREEAAQAKAEAAAVKLTSQYPLAAELLGDDLSKFDEARVAEINGRLAKEQEAESEAEPRVDVNSPRRPIARPPSGNPLELAKQALENAGNPFYIEK